MFPTRPRHLDLPSLSVNRQLNEADAPARSRAAQTVPQPDAQAPPAFDGLPRKPRPAPKPKHPLDTKAETMFADLKKTADYYMPPEESRGLPPPHLRRFPDLEFVTVSFLAADAPIGGDTRINANEISPQTLAMQAPIDSKPQYMAAFIAVAIEQKVGLIVDLTTEEERVLEKIEYGKGGDYTSKGGVRTSIKTGPEAIVAGTTQKTLTLRAEVPGAAMVGDLTRWNAPMADQRGTNAKNLLALAEQLRDWRLDNPGKSVMVHCRAGVGRTGMLVTAERLLNLHDQGRLEPEHLDDIVKDEIRSVRGQRSEKMVQKPAQIRTLLECARLLQERPPAAADGHSARASVFAKERRDEGTPPQLQRQGASRRFDLPPEDSLYANVRVDRPVLEPIQRSEGARQNDFTR